MTCLTICATLPLSQWVAAEGLQSTQPFCVTTHQLSYIVTLLTIVYSLTFNCFISWKFSEIYLSGFYSSPCVFYM